MPLYQSFSDISSSALLYIGCYNWNDFAKHIGSSSPSKPVLIKKMNVLFENTYTTT